MALILCFGANLCSASSPPSVISVTLLKRQENWLTTVKPTAMNHDNGCIVTGRISNRTTICVRELNVVGQMGGELRKHAEGRGKAPLSILEVKMAGQTCLSELYPTPSKMVGFFIRVWGTSRSKSSSTPYSWSFLVVHENFRFSHQYDGPEKLIPGCEMVYEHGGFNLDKNVINRWKIYSILGRWFISNRVIIRLSAPRKLPVYQILSS